MANDHEEIIRLRDRVHAIANAVTGLTGRVDRLDERLKALDQDVRGHVIEYEAKVEALILSDEMAKAATAALEAARAISEARWTWRQKLLAAACGLVAAICTVSTTVVVLLQASH